MAKTKIKNGLLAFNKETIKETILLERNLSDIAKIFIEYYFFELSTEEKDKIKKLYPEHFI